MAERRVRATGRQIYGRSVPLERPRRSGRVRPFVSAWQRRLLLLMIVMAVVIWGLIGWFKITSVEVSAPSRGEEIRHEALEVIRGSWRQGNLLTFDNEMMVSKLQQMDPLLKDVEVRRTWPRGIMVRATLKQPKLAWMTGGQRYLLDLDGTAIGELSANSKLPIVRDGSNLPVKIGERVTTARFVAFTAEVASALSQAKVTVTGLSIKDTTLDLTVETSRGYRIIFDTSRPVVEEMADLRSVLTLLANQKKTPAEYIDLRIAGKAYYK